jgi:formylglycine-generating enzyme required for sulfatase activity
MADDKAGGDAAADDWESFEVVEDDLDLKDAVAPADQEDIEIIDDEEMEIVEEVEEPPAAEEMADEAGGDAAADDWDSFEVVEDDLDLAATDTLAAQEDIEIIDDEEMEIVDEVEELPATEEMADEAGGGAAADDGDTFEVAEDDLDLKDAVALADQEDIEIIDDEEMEIVDEVEELPAAEEMTDDDTVEGEAADDWDSFEVVEEDDLDLAHAVAPVSLEDGEIIDDGERSVVDEVADLPGTPTDAPGPALTRSMDLSHYIEAEEALAAIPEVLQEKNEAYVQQVLERFMPKFIKIPAGLYPVGGDKKRRTDRRAATVRLSSFYIGQLPITNDLFDFFVRETGYETEAEQHGHGLVTVGRLRRDVQQKTGRHTLAVSQGVITRQIKGASWRHPDGPDSSLENRGHHPVVQVSRRDAMAFAAWAGKRLPSEDEWEAAARGKEGLLLPWGNGLLPLANLEGLQTGTTTPVTFFGRESVSPFGLLDMVGNVFEWTSSTYRGPAKGELVILKGGSWATAHVTCADRLIEPATTWANTIGFRCAVDGD